MVNVLVATHDNNAQLKKKKESQIVSHSFEFTKLLYLLSSSVFYSEMQQTVQRKSPQGKLILFKHMLLKELLGKILWAFSIFIISSKLMILELPSGIHGEVQQPQ